MTDCSRIFLHCGDDPNDGSLRWFYCEGEKSDTTIIHLKSFIHLYTHTSSFGVPARSFIWQHENTEQNLKPVSCDDELVFERDGGRFLLIWRTSRKGISQHVCGLEVHLYPYISCGPQPIYNICFVVLFFVNVGKRKLLNTYYDTIFIHGNYYYIKERCVIEIRIYMFNLIDLD